MTPRPPRIAQWLLTHLLPDGARSASIRGDLLEEFGDRTTRGSTRAARAWYRRHALAVVVRSLAGRFRSPSSTPRGRASVVDAFVVDLRSAARSLRKARGFTTASVVTLALGIGAATAVFSVVRAVLLRPLPFADPDRVMWMSEVALGTTNTTSIAWPDFQDWQQQLTSFSDLAAVRPQTFNLTGTGEPERVQGRLVTADFFRVLGISPALGRMFTRAEDRVGEPALVVLTDAFWRAHFAGDAGVLGRQMTVDGDADTIIGVLPAGFRYNSLTNDAFYLSLGRTATPDSGLPDRGNHNGLSAVARLRPGVTAAQAGADLDALETRLRQAHPDTNATVAGQVMPVTDRLSNGVAPTLETLLCAVAVLLLLAAVNVASLLVARSVGRRQELAVRAALGCGRWRLARQLFAESALLSIAGGLGGLAVAAGLVRLLLIAAPPGVPRLDEVRIDPMVALFAIVSASAAGLVLAIFPALHSSGVRGQEALVRADRGGTPGASAQRVRRGLMVAEVALAVILLTGAGLMIRTMRALTTVDPGFDPANLLTMRFVVTAHQDRSTDEAATLANARLVDFYDRAGDRLRALPGVASAAFALAIPIEGAQWNSIFIVSGQPVPARAELPSAAMLPITAGYFDTLKIPLRRGRAFDSRDSAKAARVVVVNETLARRFWPQGGAIGQRLKQGWPENVGPGSPWREIVGIVGDVKLNGVDAETPLQIYLPMTQEPVTAAALIVRATRSPEALVPAVRAALHATDPELPVATPETMAGVLSDAMVRQRLTMLIMGGFAGLALLLASVGLYGVVSHGVMARTREVGVRLALGATGRQVVALFLGQGLVTTTVGLVAGTMAGVALARTIEAQGLLFGVSARDPLTSCATALALLVVSMVACYLPARRAARVNPTITLRGE